MYGLVVPAGIAAAISMICAFTCGVLMRPVRKRFKFDLLPFHRFFAYAAIFFVLVHVLIQII